MEQQPYIYTSEASITCTIYQKMSICSELPADLWTKILARLAVRRLIRLRSVSKTMRSIIDDPYFMWLQIQHYHGGSHYDKTQVISLQTIRGAKRLQFKGSTLSLVSLDTMTEIAQLVHTPDIVFSLAGSCFGLILILCYYPRRQLRLLNASLRKSIVLPPCPLVTSQTLRLVYSFGFSSSTLNFKVVAFQVDRAYKTKQVAIYGVGDNENLWRIITYDSGLADIPVRHLVNKKDEKGMVYFQGAVHWIVCDETISSLVLTYLISFDFVSEKFGYVELPDAREEEPAFKRVFLLDERLAIMSISEVKRRIWVMNKGAHGVVSWSLWYSCASNERQVSRFFDHRCWKGRVFYLGNGSFTFGNASYDIATSKVRKLIDDDFDDNDDEDANTLTLASHLESLALCKEGEPFP